MTGPVASGLRAAPGWRETRRRFCCDRYKYDYHQLYNEGC